MIGDQDLHLMGRKAELSVEALELEPSTTYRPGRVCSQDRCPVVLSIYNEDPYCWQHRPVAYADLDPRLERARRLVAERRHAELSVDDYVLLLRDKKEVPR